MDTSISKVYILIVAYLTGTGKYAAGWGMVSDRTPVTSFEMTGNT